MALINVAGIVNDSVVDGEGYRYAIFTQGCPHGCPGCHNPQTHPFGIGRDMDTEDILKEIKDNPMLSGVTFSGGEPFCQAEALAGMADSIHALGLDIWCYTGYTLEALMAKDDPDIRELLSKIDVLVDGPFILDQRDLSLEFRGSRNQRLINMNRTRADGHVVLLELDAFLN